ncbi:MAG: hypothetical protein CVV07_15080 [Gammaproteobacteria bacterium HGW-Gammaproteobacteria-11]|nr:MAG: hypothetical protein CVV07_15080 [Gammaproteobacteria bacterium HGW-Gammaproteobacteria-11]
MIKSAFLLTTGFTFAALTVSQLPSAEPQQKRYEPSSQLSIQRTSSSERAQITTLNSGETSMLSQPQRWVF